MKPLATTVFGAGVWGRCVIETVRRVPNLALHSVCDPDVVWAGERYYSEPRAALGNAEVEAVILATPPQTHAELALAALDAGKAVLIEKPMTVSAAEAQRLVARQAEGQRLMVGHLLAYHPALSWLGQRLVAGKLGAVQGVEVVRHSPPGRRPERCPWWTLAPHDLALLRQWFGAPEQLRLRRAELGGVIAELLYAGGPQVRLDYCTRAADKRRQWSIRASRGVATLDECAAGSLALEVEGRALMPTLSSRLPLDIELDHFAACVQSGAPFKTDAVEGAAVVNWLALGQQSLQTEDWVCVAQPVAAQ